MVLAGAGRLLRPTRAAAFGAGSAVTSSRRKPNGPPRRIRIAGRHVDGTRFALPGVGRPSRTPALDRSRSPTPRSGTGGGSSRRSRAACPSHGPRGGPPWHFPPASSSSASKQSTRQRHDRSPRHHQQQRHPGGTRTPRNDLTARCSRKHRCRRPDGIRVVLGFDGSYNDDSTALIACTRIRRTTCSSSGPGSNPTATSQTTGPSPATTSTPPSTRPRNASK